MSEACRAISIARDTAYEWKAASKEFARRWDEAIEVARDRLEKEAWRRGHDGVLEPVYQGGKKVGEVRRYSDRMLEILLKGHRPNVFGDRIAVSGALELPASKDLRETARRMAFLLRAGEEAEKKKAEPKKKPEQPARRAPVALLPAPEERRFRVVNPWDGPALSGKGEQPAAQSEDATAAGASTKQSTQPAPGSEAKAASTYVPSRHELGLE